MEVNKEYMDNYFLSAFQDLQLNEAAFDIDDSGKVDELKSFVKDDIDAPVEEPIVDPNAEDEEDLQTDYVGKVIIRCNCCHSLVYKDKEDVHPSEDESLVKTKNQRGIVNKIKDYINFLDNNTEFTTTYVPVGDKIAISKRKVSNE